MTQPERVGGYDLFPELLFILFSHFCLFMVVLGVEVLGSGSWIGFLEIGFSVDRVWNLW